MNQRENANIAGAGWISYLIRKFRLHHRLSAIIKAKGVIVVALSVSVAFAVRFWLGPWLGDELPFMLFTAAALIAAWYGGAAMGILAMIVGLLLSDCFFLPAGSGTHPVELAHVVRYLFTASLGAVLIELLHRSRRRTDAVLNRLRQEMERRIGYEGELLEAKSQLAKHAQNLENQVAERTASLTRAVSSLQDVLYHIAHNLRAPLRAIEGFTSLLASEEVDQLNPTARDHLEHIAKSVARMDQLIQDLLSYGRLWQLELSLAPVSLQTAVDWALSQQSSRIYFKRAEVHVSGPLPLVRADSELLKQVLSEIIENALLFAVPSTIPRLRIWAEPEDQTVRLWIEDDGIGIDPRYADRIFDAFEVLQPTHHEGTGIGLAIVKLGIHRMGGSVGAESQPGSGSRFWLELPSACRMGSTFQFRPFQASIAKD